MRQLPHLRAEDNLLAHFAETEEGRRPVVERGRCGRCSATVLSPVPSAPFPRQDSMFPFLFPSPSVIDKFDYVFAENGTVQYKNGQLVSKQVGPAPLAAMALVPCALHAVGSSAWPREDGRPLLFSPNAGSECLTPLGHVLGWASREIEDLPHSPFSSHRPSRTTWGKSCCRI